MLGRLSDADRTKNAESYVPLNQPRYEDTTGTLNLREWTMREWTYQHGMARVDNAIFHYACANADYNQSFRG